MLIERVMLNVLLTQLFTNCSVYPSTLIFKIKRGRIERVNPLISPPGYSCDEIKVDLS